MAVSHVSSEISESKRQDTWWKRGMGGSKSRDCPSTREAEGGDSRVRGKSEMHSKTLSEGKGETAKNIKEAGAERSCEPKVGQGCSEQDHCTQEPTAAVVTCMRAKFQHGWGRDTAVPLLWLRSCGHLMAAKGDSVFFRNVVPGRLLQRGTLCPFLQGKH